jgi:hypothetical protein
MESPNPGFFSCANAEDPTLIRMRPFDGDGKTEFAADRTADSHFVTREDAPAITRRMTVRDITKSSSTRASDAIVDHQQCSGGPREGGTCAPGATGAVSRIRRFQAQIRANCTALAESSCRVPPPGMLARAHVRGTATPLRS